MNDTEDNPSSNDAVARQERQARRQAIYKERLKTPEGRKYMARVSNRFLRNTSRGRALLSSSESGGSKTSITTADYITIFSVAGFFDVASFLINLAPIIGGVAAAVLVTFPGAMITYFLYKIRGIDVSSGKNIVKFFGPMAIEFIPVVNMLPGFILGATLMLGSAKAEEVINTTINK